LLQKVLDPPAKTSRPEMKQKFIDHKFTKASLALIEQANKILNEYNQQGLTLSLRQLFYVFVSRDLIENTQREYKKIGDVISNARLAGLVDWGMMEDRTRFMRGPNSWDSPDEILESVATQYREDLWRNQPYRPEVWIEKDALVGVIERVCYKFRVKFFACRGYSSQSAQYEAGKRFEQYLQNGQKPIVLHLGDHDPSGLDMTRDNRERVSMFAGKMIELRRLALNMDQVEEYNPPPNAAKETDSRATDYIEAHGDSSWELDALEPSVINDLIEAELLSLIDEEKWKADKAQEEERKKLLAQLPSKWKAISEYLEEIQ
jgi:hypothetical protein